MERKRANANHHDLFLHDLEAGKWEVVFCRFNQFGTFENVFTDELGLTGLR